VATAKAAPLLHDMGKRMDFYKRHRFMNKATYICFVFVLSVTFGAPGDLPSDVQWLLSKRSEAVQKIDRTFIKELKKFKVKYTKAGDLNSANIVNRLILQTKEKSEKEFTMIDGPWIAGAVNRAPWGLRYFDGNIMLDQKGGKHEVIVNNNTITIKWGGRLYEELHFDPSNPDKMKGTSNGKISIIYTRVKMP
jgi:hypothetical protein